MFHHFYLINKSLPSTYNISKHQQRIWLKCEAACVGYREEHSDRTLNQVKTYLRILRWCCQLPGTSVRPESMHSYSFTFYTSFFFFKFTKNKPVPFLSKNLPLLNTQQGVPYPQRKISHAEDPVNTTVLKCYTTSYSNLQNTHTHTPF